MLDFTFQTCHFSSVPHYEDEDEDTPQKGVTKVAPANNEVVAINNSMPNVKKRPEFNAETPCMNSIADGVEEICENLRSKEKADHIMEEWKGIARVIDRIFFWVCSIVVISACIAMFSRRDEYYGHHVPTGLHAAASASGSH